LAQAPLFPTIFHDNRRRRVLATPDSDSPSNIGGEHSFAIVNVNLAKSEVTESLAEFPVGQERTEILLSFFDITKLVGFDGEPAYRKKR
jgi:hypothetical protein